MPDPLEVADTFGEDYAGDLAAEVEADPYDGVPEVVVDPDHVDDEAGEHLPADMIPEDDE